MEGKTKVQNTVTGRISDDEMIVKILTILGVDSSDWGNSLSGIYAAIRSNMQIGEPHMSKVEDWTDADEITSDTLTAAMFKLVERAQKAELEPEYLQGQLQECADVLNVFAQFANIKAHEHEHVTISVSIDTLREAKRLLGGAFRDMTSGADIPV